MKSVILTFLLLGTIVSSSFAQLTLYPTERSVFSLNNDTGFSKSFQPSTQLEGFPIFRLNRELKFIEVENSDGKKTQFKVSRIIHAPHTKYWEFISIRNGNSYEIHFNLEDKYISFRTPSDKYPFLYMIDKYTIGEMFNNTKDPYWEM